MRDYLVLLRSQRNETQQDVADALGLSLQYYTQIEEGLRQKNMDLMLLASIAGHFRLPIEQVVDWEGNWAENQPLPAGGGEPLS